MCYGDEKMLNQITIPDIYLLKYKILGSGVISDLTSFNIVLSGSILWVVKTFRQARIGFIVYKRFDDSFLLCRGEPPTIQ